MRSKITFTIALLLLSAQLLSGCAITNRANTPTLNLVEDKLFPESKNAQYMAYPVLLPISITAATFDMLLVHPTRQIPVAWQDTTRLFDGPFDWEKQYVTEATVMPFRVAMAPMYFSTNLMLRSFLDLQGQPLHHSPQEK